MPELIVPMQLHSQETQLGVVRHGRNKVKIEERERNDYVRSRGVYLPLIFVGRCPASPRVGDYFLRDIQTICNNAWLVPEKGSYTCTGR